MRKILTLLLAISMALVLCACNAQKLEATILTTILYNSTPLTEIQKSDGATVKVTGYMSMASPLDNTCAYLMNVPFNPEPMAHTSNSNVTDMIACYPPTGQYIPFTEECVTVTGTIKATAMTKDALGYSYPFYLVDCTYEVYQGADAISEYNYGITSTCLVEVDSWLTSVYNGLADPEHATVIDIKTNRDSYDVKRGERVCPGIDKLVAEVQKLTVAYNEWVETSPTSVSDDLTALYLNVGTVMQDWLQTLEVKGDEV